jgi:hypothetical protein
MNRAAAVKGTSIFDWLAGMQDFPHRADVIGNFLDYRPGAITDFCGVSTELIFRSQRNLRH